MSYSDLIFDWIIFTPSLSIRMMLGLNSLLTYLVGISFNMLHEKTWAGDYLALP
jgi:hypothetical protein